MPQLLLSRRMAGAPRPLLSVLASTLLHAAVVVSLVAGSGRIVREFDRGVTSMLRYLLPPNRAAAPSIEPMQFLAAGVGSGDVGQGTGSGRTAPVAAPLATAPSGGQGVNEPSSVPVPEPVPEDHAFSIVDVDSVALRDPGSAAPNYPKALMERGIEGYVIMRFVVDSTGSIDMETVRTVEATNPEFTTAVREVMPRMKFRPAKMGAIAVRQLAEQPFTFRIQKAPDTPPPPKKKP